MHPNPIYRQTPANRNLAFARRRGFGALLLNGAEGPLAAHVPFVLSVDGKSAELHLMRSNPIARATGAPLPALLAVTGPDAYVSPDWYGLVDQVPTWNYVAVHLRGTLHPLSPADLAGVLDRLSAEFEGRLAPKSPWTSAKMPADLMARLMRSITAFRLDIAAVEGTWKLGQNKPAPARNGAADGLAAAGIGSEADVLAQMMRAVDSEAGAP